MFKQIFIKQNKHQERDFFSCVSVIEFVARVVQKHLCNVTQCHVMDCVGIYVSMYISVDFCIV